MRTAKTSVDEEGTILLEITDASERIQRDLEYIGSVANCPLRLFFFRLQAFEKLVDVALASAAKVNAIAEKYSKMATRVAAHRFSWPFHVTPEAKRTREVHGRTKELRLGTYMSLWYDPIRATRKKSVAKTLAIL
jgi:hypothetical protein